MSEGLELESRRRIYDFLVANPGTHLRRIGHALGMSTGMLSYHLGYLERKGVLKAEEDGHRKRYFIARAFVEAQRRILAVLRQDVPRKILVELLTYEGRTFAELQASVGVSKSTLSYHLQKLMHRDLLVRTKRERESVFTIKDLEEIRGISGMMKSSARRPSLATVPFSIWPTSPAANSDSDPKRTALTHAFPSWHRSVTRSRLSHVTSIVRSRSGRPRLSAGRTRSPATGSWIGMPRRIRSLRIWLNRYDWYPWTNMRRRLNGSCCNAPT